VKPLDLSLVFSRIKGVDESIACEINRQKGDYLSYVAFFGYLKKMLD
jgi:hypothetical protein